MKNDSDIGVKIDLAGERELRVPKGINLRQALRGEFSFLYHPKMRPIHCRGLGTCGTCAVSVKGLVSPPTAMERWRLNFPPHKMSLEKGLRLACQTQVLGDVVVEKKAGLWGSIS